MYSKIGWRITGVLKRFGDFEAELSFILRNKLLIIIIITKIFYCASKCRSKLRGAGLCTLAFSPARQRTILNNHRVIDITTNTSVMLNCALVTYLVMTAVVGLPDDV